MMNATRQQDTARLALAIGIVAAGSAVCLATYFAIQGPFGTINDLGNGTAGVLSAGLAWRLRRQLSGTKGQVAVGAAIVGAALTVTGSALVISETTGFFLAGLVSSLGFAGIGTWLIALNRSETAVVAWPSACGSWASRRARSWPLGSSRRRGSCCASMTWPTLRGGCGSARWVGSGRSSSIRPGRSGSANVESRVAGRSLPLQGGSRA